MTLHDKTEQMRYAVVFFSRDGEDMYMRHATMYNDEPTENDLKSLCLELATEEKFGLVEDIHDCDLMVLDRENESMSEFFEWFDVETADGDWEFEEHLEDDVDEIN